MLGFFSSNNGQWKYDELPTPLTKEDYLNLADQATAEKMEWINSDGWEFMQNNNGVLLEQKPLEGSNISVVKASATLTNVDFNTLFHNLYQPTLQERKKLYDEILTNDLIKEKDENNKITHSKFQGPTGITSREFVTLKTKKAINDGYLICVHSINDENIPFTENFVRGTTRCGTLITPNDNGIEVITVEHVDPKGWIPTVIINQFKGKVGQRLTRMQNIYGKN